MRLWARVLLIVASSAAAYAVWRFPRDGLTTLVLVLGTTWLARTMYASKLAKNPLGNDRDWSVRPALVTTAKGLALFVAAFVWAALMAVAVRGRVLPDTQLVALAVFGPALVLLVLSGLMLFKAFTQFGLGSSK